MECDMTAPPTWLTDRLPSPMAVPMRSEADYYGAGALVARRLGLRRVPLSGASWCHGWVLLSDLQDARELVQWARPGARHLVPRPEHAEWLKRLGCRHAEAVGVPFVYVDDPDVERRPGSLLVMPPHSLPYTSHKWAESEYVDAIRAVSGRFSEVVVCISKACADNGLWTKSFERSGFPWITGAAIDDGNALLRMRKIFSMFDCMTTNAIGSHVAYAAYSGCKVSLWGPFAEYRSEDFRRDPWYCAHPQFLERSLDVCRERSVRQRFPFLFVDPWNATDRTEWGAYETGAKYRRPFPQLARLLGWGFWSQCRIVPNHACMMGVRRLQWRWRSWMANRPKTLRLYRKVRGMVVE
jgi:hypothetical protein